VGGVTVVAWLEPTSFKRLLHMSQFLIQLIVPGSRWYKEEPPPADSCRDSCVFSLSRGRSTKQPKMGKGVSFTFSHLMFLISSSFNFSIVPALLRILWVATKQMTVTCNSDIHSSVCRWFIRLYWWWALRFGHFVHVWCSRQSIVSSAIQPPDCRTSRWILRLTSLIILTTNAKLSQALLSPLCQLVH